MQPYFVPYIGYWQLIEEVDLLVVSDDTKYTKQSWINRNIIWINGERRYLTLPIEKHSDNSKILDRQIAESFDSNEMWRKILHDYKKCENTQVEELVRTIIYFQEKNLVKFLLNSIYQIMDYLDISTEVILASELDIPTKLIRQERIFHVASRIGMNNYTNLPGGQFLYSHEEFQSHDLNLEFVVPKLSPYKTRINKFYPSLSILDLLFQAEGKDEINRQIKDYSVAE